MGCVYSYVELVSARQLQPEWQDLMDFARRVCVLDVNIPHQFRESISLYVARSRLSRALVENAVLDTLQVNLKVRQLHECGDAAS